MADPTPGQVRKKATGRPKGCKCNGSGAYCPVHPERYQGDPAPADGSGPPAGQPDATNTAERLTSMLRGAVGKPPEPEAPAEPPPPRDPPPKTTPKRKRTNKATTAEIEQLLAGLLVAPAIPARAMLGCEYCMMHFLTEGPKAAHELALLSEDHPDLRRLLVRMHDAWTTITWGAILAAYIGKPLLHHVAPDPFLAAAGPVLGVPPRPARAKGHAHQGGQPGQAPPPDPERQAEAMASMDRAHTEAINAGLTADHADGFARGVASAIMQGYTYESALAAVWAAYREHLEHEAPPAAPPMPDDAETADALA